ncbi:hypothetical protein FC804_15415 [Clostridium botulinum]|nr:hypothetical protein [Clostridium botulinum]
MTTYSPFELEPIFIDFKNESYNLGLDIQANQNDTLTLNFICRNNGIEEDMSKYKVELRVHNNNSNTDYIQTQNENVTLGADGSVKIVCQSKNGNKLTAYSGQCNGVLRIFNTESKQKATRIITMRIVADPLETDRANICESTITKLEDLDWILNEAYNIEDEFKKAIEEAIKQKAELTAKISESVTAKNNLNSTIQTANNTNNTLNATNTTAVNTKNELNNLNTTANNTKSNLDKSNTTALGTNKTLTDTNTTAINTNSTLNTTINNANKSKTDLDTSKNNADKSKSALDGSISTGNTLKTNLDGSISTGTTLKNDIDNRIVTGNKLKTDMDNSSTVATTKKEQLDGANVQAEKNIETLNSFGDASQLTKDVTTLKTKVLENTLTSIKTDNVLTKLPNSENGFVRNMQLKGKTLQNLWNGGNVNYLSSENRLIETTTLDLYKTNTNYTIINYNNKKIKLGIFTKANTYSRSIEVLPNSKFIIRLNDEIIKDKVGEEVNGWANSDNDKNELKKSIVILEGEVKEIPPYFEGIQSTGELEGNKISILSHGKNLIKNGNGENELGFWIKRGNITFEKFGEFTGNQWTGIDQIIKVKQNTDYTVSCKHSSNSGIYVMGIKSTDGNTLTFNTGNNNQVTVSLQNKIVGSQTVTFAEFQLLESTTATTYETYKEDKTEILLPSPHMGLPDGTSDIVYYDKNERIKNISKDIWNGNEDWTVNSSIDNEIVFQSLFSKSKTTSSIKGEVIFNKNLKVIAFTETNIFARIDKSQLSTPDVAGFKKLLKTWADAGTPLEVFYQLATPVVEKLNIKDTLQAFENGYIQLNNAITPTAQLEYSTNIPSAIGGLTQITDKLVDDVTNVEITISDLDAELDESRKGKTTLEERLEEDRTNILKKFNELDNQDIFKITEDIKNKNIKILGDSIGAGVGGTGYSATGEIIVGNNKSNETGHCWANSFRDYLQSKYNCIVKNWSVSGWKSSDIVTNISTLITETDDIVICAIGANNCYIENGITLLESDIKTINEYCENHNKKVIFIGTIQTLTSSHENKGIKMEDIDNLLREVTTNLNVCFIPMYKLFNDYLLYSGADSSLFYYNEEHPNDNGYDAMFYLMANYMGFYTDLELRNKLYSLYDTGWLPLPLINGTVANTIDIPSYRRVGKMLSLKGEIDNIISTVTTVATLPSGFTPNSKFGGSSIALSFFWTGADTQSRMFINKNGNIIVPNHTDTKKMWLDGINFMID